MTTQQPGTNSNAAAPPPGPAASAPTREVKHDASVLDAILDETLKYKYALEPTTSDEAWQAAQRAYKARLVASVDEAYAKMAIGRPLGVPAFACIQRVYLLENKKTGLVTPCLAASAKLGLLLASKSIEYVIPGELTATTATWVGKRRGGKEVTATFTRDDAVRALLVGRGGAAEGGNNHDKYPVDMLSWRACGRLCDRIGADVLMGIATYEDLDEAYRQQNEELAEAAASPGGLSPALADRAPPPQAAPARDFAAEAEALRARIGEPGVTAAVLEGLKADVLALGKAGAPEDAVKDLKRLWTAAKKAVAAPAPAPPPAAAQPDPGAQGSLLGGATAPPGPAAPTERAPAADPGQDDGDALGGRM